MSLDAILGNEQKTVFVMCNEAMVRGALEADVKLISCYPGAPTSEVLDTFNKKGTPWYRVSAFDQRKEQIGTGWINSTALLGQQLKAY